MGDCGFGVWGLRAGSVKRCCKGYYRRPDGLASVSGFRFHWLCVFLGGGFLAQGSGEVDVGFWMYLFGSVVYFRGC